MRWGVWLALCGGFVSENALARPVEGVPVGTGEALPVLSLSAPTGGWTVGRMMLVAGEVSDHSINPVVLSINGDRYLMRTREGRFSRRFPAAYGRNVVTVQATNRAGTATAQATTFAQIPPVPLKAVLTSDTDGVYTDLHVYEPSRKTAGQTKLDPWSMSHVYWARTSSPSGGTFFLNSQGDSFDQPGYGPYLYIHRAPPRGAFALAANYWPMGDKAHTIGTLNISLFEGTPQETKRVVTVPLATRGTTKVLAWVLMRGDGQALIHVPGQEPTPQGEGWPENLEEATKQLEKGRR